MVAALHAFSPTQLTWQAKPGGQVVVAELQPDDVKQLMTQVPATHPPLHRMGQPLAGGAGAEPQEVPAIPPTPPV
jgi:hypothetical protein